MVSSVPDNAVGQACLNYLRQFGLNLEYVQERLAPARHLLRRDRRRAAALHLPLQPQGQLDHGAAAGDIDWARIFDGKHWFHFTGITPALADSVAELTREACAAATRNGLTVSCDLNFRRKLWSAEKAREVMTGLMEHVDVLFTNEEEAETLFGIAARGHDVKAGKDQRARLRGRGGAAARAVQAAVRVHHAPREPLGDGQRLVGHALRRQAVLHEPQVPHRLTSSTASAAATRIPRASSMGC